MTATPVMISINADEEKLKTAQVAFVDGVCWVAYGAGWMESALMRFKPLPQLPCPVIDLSPVVSDDESIQLVIHRHMAPYGFTDLEAMIDSLVALGAVVVGRSS